MTCKSAGESLFSNSVQTVSMTTLPAQFDGSETALSSLERNSL